MSVDHGGSSLSGSLRKKSRSRRDGLSRWTERDVGASPRNDLLPELAVAEIDIAALRPPRRNARALDAVHVQEVARSIASVGFVVPVLIDRDNRVIDGMVKVEAAKRLGLTRVPCIRIGHLTEAEVRVLRLALNRLQEKGSWDLGALKLEFDELILEDAPLEITGFSAIEIDQIRLDETPDPVETGPLEPDPKLKPIARPGDIFGLGRHRVACGDARDEPLMARLVGDSRVRLVLTDVPYNVPVRGHVTGSDHREFAMASGEMSSEAYEAFNAAWMATAMTRLVPGGVLSTFIDWRGYPTIERAASAAGLSALNLIVWSKTNAGMGSLYRSAHELLPLFKKGTEPHVNNVELGKHGRWRSNVWTYPGASSIGSDARKGLRSHPTVKPTAMLQDALIDLTRGGEIVLDPFLGSGSTVIAADATDRTCYGVELDPLYVDVILRRFEAATGQAPKLVSAIGEPDSADGEPV